MNEIKIKCPAKINLDLRVFPKNDDGFHNIKSIMQTISLCDFVTIKIFDGNSITLSGSSNEIPYDENNLCYKAAKLFLNEINKNLGVSIHIEKNIPVCAGLAGGSTDAAGVLYGLNQLLDYPLSIAQINNLALKLGSDLNFCLVGGTKLCRGRGEILTDMPFFSFDLSIIMPIGLKISAKEAYTAFDELHKESTFRNDLEFALINKYKQLKYLSSLGFQMSGSGPAYFSRTRTIDINLDKNKFYKIENLTSVNHGVIAS